MTPPDKITVTLLKPCPFCGGEAVYRSFPDQRHISHYVECADGPCDVTLCAGNTKAEAIAAWNTRAATAPLLDLIERARADLSECPKWLQCVPSHEAGSTTDLLIDRINTTLATLAKLRDEIARGEG